MGLKRKQEMAHFYTGEKKPPSTVQNLVHVAVMNKQKRPWVVKKSFGIQKINKPSKIFTVESTPTLSHNTPIQPTGADFASDNEDNGGCTSEGPQETQSKKTAYARTEAFFPHLDEFQEVLMAQETETNVGQSCSSCRAENSAIYRCRECFISSALCSVCIVERHKHQPLHHIQAWTGTYFETHTLCDLGLVLHLGHDGKLCPASLGPKEMVILHTNGIHRCSVQFCDCNSLVSNLKQLIYSQLFPATVSFPATAFSFALLTTFHQLTLCSKITPYDYFDTLRKLTNAAFPQDVEDRYKELMVVMRIWRHLAERRRSGQEHNIDSQLPHRRPHSLAVRCPACPEVNFNVDAEELESALDTATHKYTLFISLDGNFRLNQTSKYSDPNDVPLNKGNAYFVNQEQFGDYLKCYDDSSSVHDSLCSKLKAVRQQQTVKFTNTKYSGVVATQCARHNFYLAQGIVNLVKGETYVRTDFALGSALGAEALDQRWIMISYDIWCQYSINLKDRMKQRFPILTDTFDNDIRGAVPSLHIHGHGPKCQMNSSFMYTKFSGRTCGEGIESAWAEQNHAAGSTKEQSTGHRQDTLDDFNAYWNWTKLHRLPKFLLTQFEKYWAEWQETSVDFTRLSSRFSVETRLRWEEMEKKPLLGRDGKPYSIYQVDSTHLPSQRTQSERLTNLNSNSHTIPMSHTDSERFMGIIEEGIEIQRLQNRVRDNASTLDFCQDTLNDDRQNLQKSINQWHVQYHELFPQVAPFVSTGSPENETLELPSSYSADQRRSFNLGALSQFEYEIRLGQAYDSINDIRTAIHIYNASCQEKKTQVFGQRPATRAWAILSSLKDDIRERAKGYHLSYTALLSLGLRKDSELKVIKETDLWGKDMALMRKQGDSKRKEPWYWVIGKPNDLSDDAWELELERVRYFRARATRDRLLEEVEILDQEFRRTFNSFTKMNNIWRTVGDIQFQLKIHIDVRLANGYRAFAYCQAEMYAKLASATLQNWSTARSLTEDKKKD